MTDNSVYLFIDELVKGRLSQKRYPSHVLLNELRIKAGVHFLDYSGKKFTEILHRLIRAEKIHYGKTANDFWLSTQKHNIYERQ